MASLKFPDNFIWGTATSSYQIEGAAFDDGKGVSVWDSFTHKVPSPIADGRTGDVACDSYNLYKEDIRLLKELGVQYYRLSFSWPRLLPQGTTANVNEAGVQYYRNLITEVLNNGIKPSVTLLHWDHPQALDDHGGWLNDHMIDYFADYAKFCFQRFGDIVKHWVTINEPWVISWMAYGIGNHAPGHCEAPATYPYMAAHNMIKAHAKAYRIYDHEFRSHQGGRVGIVLVFTYGEPASNKQEDIEAAERQNQFHMGWFANPIFVNGDYPEIMKEQISKKSQAEGRFKSRLPEFSEDEKRMIKGSCDFLGLNYYLSQLVQHVPAWRGRSSYTADQDTKIYSHMTWKRCHTWVTMTPWGLKKALCFVRDRYGNPEVWITENGCSEGADVFQDDVRIEYIGKHLAAVHAAITEDKCNIKAYFAWSLMDNFEWGMGYTHRFGLYHVDFDDPKRPRKPKTSAKFYSRIVRTNQLHGDFPFDRTRELCTIM